MTASEAYMDELAAKVAERVVADLRRAPAITPRLLTVDQAAIYLGRSETATRHLIASGALKNSSPDARVQVDIKGHRNFDYEQQEIAQELELLV